MTELDLEKSELQEELMNIETLGPFVSKIE